MLCDGSWDHAHTHSDTLAEAVSYALWCKVHVCVCAMCVRYTSHTFSAFFYA